MAEPKLGRERGEEPGQRAKPHTGPRARGRGEGRSGHPRTVLCHKRPDGQISRVSFYTWEPRRVCMVEDNWTGSTRICLAFPIDNPRFMLAWPRQASWGGRRPRGEPGSPLGWFCSVQAAKQRRITAGAPADRPSEWPEWACGRVCGSAPRLRLQVPSTFGEWQRRCPAGGGRATRPRRPGAVLRPRSTCPRVRPGPGEAWTPKRAPPPLVPSPPRAWTFKNLMKRSVTSLSSSVSRERCAPGQPASPGPLSGARQPLPSVPVTRGWVPMGHGSASF